ncbi:uncharacterized protein C8A04DRAFT_14623 [Dichotomopilus funicola]|uniref:Box C/D snoRNA protein 1 n=1 Tax=Dichotomopilus funicola TaxID=1934379 RepID=A0AAN6ZK46_9PEZI|nr:hypothetical protein C8A04DRAFT_14623 [Dichotomopilus funicola]
MSGTVLSTLCSICHAQPPKYRCPRCSARTCSVPCIQKHKARADCDGQRNPRAFMPLKQLKTASGVDHDYNFLTSIERARERAEKDIVEARRLLSEKELRPQNEEKVFQKVWHRDELHHVPVQHQSYKKHGKPQEGLTFIDGFDKHVRRRLRFLDIEATTMPKGMARQKENATAWNRRTQSINWQVEWLVYHVSELGLAIAPPNDQDPLRILHKTLEGKPLHSGLASTLDWHRGQLDRQTRTQTAAENGHDAEAEIEADDGAPPSSKKRKLNPPNKSSTESKPRPSTQDPWTGTWPAAPYTTQYPHTSAWTQTTTLPHADTTLEETLVRWEFYMLSAHTSNDSAPAKSRTKKVIPLASTETLTSALTGRTIIEFPTIIAVPHGWGVPAGYTVGSTERRAPRVGNTMLEEEGNRMSTGRGDNSKKRTFESRFEGSRRGGSSRGGGMGYGRGGKRFKPNDGGRPQVPRDEDQSDAEEGEIGSDDDDDEETGVGNADAVLTEGGPVLPPMMDVDWDADRSSMTLGREVGYGGGSVFALGSEADRSSMTFGREEEEQEDGEVKEEGGMERARGLVDYGSSDESD